MDFTAMAKGLAVISFGLTRCNFGGIGTLAAASRTIQETNHQCGLGLVLVGLATFLVGFF